MNIDMITAAADRLHGTARVTPLLSSPALDALAGRRVLVKPECLQRTGSFKFRGAYNALAAMPAEKRAKGVLAYSSGNHAQGIAHSAQLFGVPAVIIMPADAPQLKIEGTRSYGAEVVLYDRGRESREEIGDRLAKERGLTLVKPYDEPQVIAGQGTCGLEIADQAQAMGVTEAEVLVCCGGGGLTAGIALALQDRAPGFTPRPVEPIGYDDTARSLKSGQRERNTSEAGGLCDAILPPTPGELTFPILQTLCGSGITVTDHDAMRAMALAFQHLKVVAEPGGAVALAGALFDPTIQSDTVICTISGGNVDPQIFAQALTRM
ncbi:threonine ammonia-lyase [Sagittula sp. SSi028]|uniref:threonine ammonia-lyase n=1 Tax=Sagittula sp. SSi028 TaxID=3400636 RepID=UPI003AF90BB2